MKYVSDVSKNKTRNTTGSETEKQDCPMWPISALLEPVLVGFRLSGKAEAEQPYAMGNIPALPESGTWEERWIPCYLMWVIKMAGPIWDR